MSAKNTRTFRSLVTAASRGVVAAQYQLAAMLASGDGTEKDLAAAAHWYSKAAAKEHPEALYNLGLMYVLGEAGRPAVKKGIALIKRAARLEPGMHNGSSRTYIWSACTVNRAT